MARWNRFAAATALAAAFSLSASPAMARGYHHWHRHHDGIDGGDVLAGALIIGGIAAIASAANKQDREERAPAPPPVPRDRQGYGYDGPGHDRGLDRAAGMCADAVDEGRDRVDTIDNVARDRDGWAVSGVLQGGAGFTCRIGNDGRVQDVDVGGKRADASDRQYDDDYYARAREAQRQPADDNATAQPDNRPEWHGDAPQSKPQAPDDGRYDASQAPDFSEGG